MLTLAISCLTTSHLPWFVDLTFQVPMRIVLYGFGLYFHHQTHPQLSVVSALAHLLRSSMELVIALFSTPDILDTFQPGGLIFWCHLFLLFHIVLGFSWQEYCGVGCHSPLQWTTFCQYSLLWPVRLGWPCTAWLSASLSYTGPFITRLCSVKGRLLGEVEAVGLSDYRHNMERKGRGCQESWRNRDMPWEGQVWREEQWL